MKKHLFRCLDFAPKGAIARGTAILFADVHINQSNSLALFYYMGLDHRNSCTTSWADTEIMLVLYSF